ncbi:MAG: hypothetical protein UX35_C0003G0011 [Microgenomates group bacterium GW2011_GWA1_46_15]|nr:MAG: hypothetical protein UX35_C0003G0011 [Microgenomates group bacterium GW2011_GWA1_46_15]
MTVREITADWLKTQKWQIQKPNTVTIDGVLLKELTVHLDGRGDVIELWSEKWLSGRPWRRDRVVE